MTLKQVYKKFPTEISCINMLEEIIWGNTPKCPYCNSNNSTPLITGNRYHCNTCNTSYSVTVNTIFHKTKVPLQVWFYIIFLKESGSLNIPLRELSEILNITKDTANRIVNKVNNFHSLNFDLYKKIYTKLL